MVDENGWIACKVAGPPTTSLPYDPAGAAQAAPLFFPFFKFFFTLKKIKKGSISV